MRVSLDFSALGKTTWYEYAVRFLFGGGITIVAGLLAKQFGPVFGGLFLAFPAIFPASATLVEKHERQKKLDVGIVETARGRQAAALDAYGAAIGSIGLVGFASVAWKLLPLYNAAVALLAATCCWLMLSMVIWSIGKRHGA